MPQVEAQEHPILEHGTQLLAALGGATNPPADQ
jgi:hypothetical protein